MNGTFREYRYAPVFEPDPRETWREFALCAQVDPEVFFPDKGGTSRTAKKICVKCTVREPCLERALACDERSGIFGGLNVHERRALKKRRAA